MYDPHWASDWKDPGPLGGQQLNQKVTRLRYTIVFVLVFTFNMDGRHGQ